ncbi:MAG: arginine repressor [Clostridia bacterium]|nr:arginine repressor [Clostridia bacterium]
MKKGRQEKIIELITKYEINTQDDLIDMLGVEGYKVTQATVSRDIRDLDLVKVATPGGSYKYVVSRLSKNGVGGVSLLRNPIVETVVNITAAQNIVVLKTTPGMAGAVATFIDRMPDSNILGSVAGDDTIIIVTPDNDAAVATAEKFKSVIAL